ncbi:DUF1493 family protein [Cronobacter malonaticus]|uniref:DUF1493 family protein n=1 Tax=Cronobacter malonaticus TaxID=413503 RepID=UPI002895DECC|nr:DUF1493 family protein [Cronobacter malonaticus]ELY5941135.1 DUF1493 family protein [Cronobacter malonaticus]ELY6205510.1 DUF1493 family protein [Cronobacter malonaticus]ELY6257882.1 DUF1493 family protein [Cronobacter malonaticus]ELY6260380.1 DUF1493 family protein [Cronobacter malonaticus]MDT3562203.1 DUF1493 family protein [Cronobacter malonaticus]
MAEDIEKRVIEMFTIRSGSYLFRKKKYDTYTAESSIHFDVRLDHDDVEELIEDYSKEFNVDMSNFHLETYYPTVNFSWNPFKKPEPVDVPEFTIDMFIQSAKAGRWLYE